MNNTKNTVIGYIASGHYKKAKAISFDVMSEKAFYDLIINLGFETESVAIYTFICFLLIERESSHLHQLAAVLISQGLSHVEGAYSSGLFHAKRAIELSPNITSYKEYILLFHTIPDKLLNDAEAKIIANEILLQDPNNITALKTLDEIAKDTKLNSHRI